MDLGWFWGWEAQTGLDTIDLSAQDKSRFDSSFELSLFCGIIRTYCSCRGISSSSTQTEKCCTRSPFVGSSSYSGRTMKLRLQVVYLWCTSWVHRRKFYNVLVELIAFCSAMSDYLLRYIAGRISLLSSKVHYGHHFDMIFTANGFLLLVLCFSYRIMLHLFLYIVLPRIRLCFLLQRTSFIRLCVCIDYVRSGDGLQFRFGGMSNYEYNGSGYVYTQWDTFLEPGFYSQIPCVFCIAVNYRIVSFSIISINTVVRS